MKVNDYVRTHNCKVLLDYITNLQEENERLKLALKGTTHCYDEEEHKKLKEENNILRKNAEHNDKVVDKSRWNEMIYKSRIAKAKEYIMSNLITEWNIKNGGNVSGSDLPADEIIPILNILNGGDVE